MWLAVLGACGDSTAPPIDAAPPPVGLADLAPVADQMQGQHTVTYETFRDDDPAQPNCEVENHCVLATGTRKLLRFPTFAMNTGTARLELPPVPAPGAEDATYQWSACNRKHHVRDFASFELFDGDHRAAVQRKQAFCVEDSARIVVGAQSAGFSCTHQGISIGWADVYETAHECEYLDVTGLAAGTYTLRVTINPSGTIVEASPNNNVVEWAVTIPPDPAP